MPRDAPDIRPQTHALDALIRKTVSRVRHAAGERPADTMLFLGNWHQAFPALVVQDPVLEPVDKVVWMVICASARAAGIHTAFPSYAEIARLANVASTSTISRSVAILRATRWLSLCARVRDVGGRFRGNVYALHDEPLPLADALYLDPGYMQALRAARTHHHARVRRVVDAVLESIDEDIGEGRDVLAPESALERRLEALRAVHGGESRRYFTFSAAVLSRLASSVPHAPSIDRDQKSKADPDRLRNSSPQNSKAVSSSSYIYKTTTTTPSSAAQKSKAAVAHAALVYPERLSANQRGLAARYLASIPGEHRQGVLDELEGRLQAERQGAKAVYDELRYLHHLCRQVNRGAFVPNLGLKVRSQREQRQHDGEHQRREAREREDARQRQRSQRASGAKAMGEIRKALGMRPFSGVKKD